MKITKNSNTHLIQNNYNPNMNNINTINSTTSIPEDGGVYKISRKKKKKIKKVGIKRT